MEVPVKKYTAEIMFYKKLGFNFSPETWILMDQSGNELYGILFDSSALADSD